MFKHINFRKAPYSISMSILSALLIVGVGAISIAYHLHGTTTRYKTVSLQATRVSTTIPKASANNFNFPEVGIKLTLPSGLAPGDIQYYAQIDRAGTAADPHLWSTVGLTTKSLLQLDSGCTAAAGSTGMIVRYSEDPKAIKAVVRESLPLGKYYFAFAAPQGSCSMNPDAQKLERTQVALLEKAFETVSVGN